MRKTGARPTNHALASARGRGIRTRNIAKTRSKPCNTMCTSARQQPNSNAQWTWSTQWAFRPVKSYQSSKPGWVTREKVKVDRVACPWLIRKFIDPQAEFLFVPVDQVM